jgi:hypothetical protein
MVLFKASLMTYQDVGKLDNNVFKLCEIPKACGGYGLWATRRIVANAHKPPPIVTTRVKIKAEARFGPWGSANMTDTFLDRICVQHNVTRETVLDIRNEMVADSLLTGLGPQRYGRRRHVNTDQVSQHGKGIKIKPAYNVKLNPQAMLLVEHIANELLVLRREPHSLRHAGLMTPDEMVASAISKQNCLNLKLYMRVNNMTDSTLAYRLLTNHHRNQAMTRMSERLWAKGDEVATLFCAGKIDCCFWSAGCKINVEVAALIRRFVIYWLAREGNGAGLIYSKQLSKRVYWDTLATMIAKEVWIRVGDVYSCIAY